MSRLLVFLLVIGVITSPLFGSQVVVQPDGERPIEDAVNLSLPGDTIVIMPGLYRENAITISKRLTILGRSEVTIDGMDEPENIFLIMADSVVVEGISFKGVGVSFLTEIAAVKLRRCAGVRIVGNQISNCFFGIYLEYASDCVIEGNEIYGLFTDEASAGNAIHVWKADRIVVANNTAHGHRDGIYFEFVDDSHIEGNRSYSNLRYGLHFMFSNRDTYSRNVFRNNGAGVAVMFSKEIVMEYNDFKENWGGASYGLLLKEISDGRIEHNNFDHNTIGILAEGANRLSIASNEFVGNGTAIDMKGNSLENKVARNNFIANTFEVVTNSKYNNNEYYENYWSGYTGYDLNRDGFGDVPYRPVNLFAKVTQRIPSATIMMHSIIVGLIEMTEKTFPQIIPQELLDRNPKMTAYNYDRG